MNLLFHFGLLLVIMKEGNTGGKKNGKIKDQGIDKEMEGGKQGAGGTDL